MHAYLITEKPGTVRRALRAAGTCAIRILAVLVMGLLGILVLTVRCTRPVVNYVAVRAVWLEAWASKVTGLPQVGAAVGVGLTDEFVREFRNGFHAHAGSAR
ncbi:hypothetical protein EAO71_36160 [Streptomyces sp. ms191]|uniref:hypothetical protein n=1 Tax=Streptomyces sp. ms191 TaxID=1827978 RepID=UPI0011CD64F8|nr:hypothetical protein [Streptomyces sp. ms191]TXS12870.1 hypothetical protein EAO71_36160 [Streptomyces sp. ms191]